MSAEYVMPVADIGRSVMSLLIDTGPFAKFILLILAVLSVVSWAVIYDRIRLYRRLLSGGRKLQAELAAKGLAVSMATVEKCMPSIEGALLVETKRYLEEARPGGNPSGSSTTTVQLKDLLDGRATTEISEMEKYLIFLATTASVSPFLGLLGTVWGIMSSFLSMGVEGSASIEVVGPGIAEALATTIAGLGAAIVAVVGYNLLIRHVRRQETRIELFVSRIVALTAVKVENIPRVDSEVAYEKKPI